MSGTLNEFELGEYRLEITSKYDEWLEKTEGRGASYGELAYIEGLDEQGLADMESELDRELELA